MGLDRYTQIGECVIGYPFEGWCDDDTKSEDWMTRGKILRRLEVFEVGMF